MKKLKVYLISVVVMTLVPLLMLVGARDIDKVALFISCLVMAFLNSLIVLRIYIIIQNRKLKRERGE